MKKKFIIEKITKLSGNIIYLLLVIALYWIYSIYDKNQSIYTSAHAPRFLFYFVNVVLSGTFITVVIFTIRNIRESYQMYLEKLKKDIILRIENSEINLKNEKSILEDIENNLKNNE